MAESPTLTRIGSNVTIQVDQVRDRIPGNLLKTIKANPRGRVIDYKMTDSNGIGLILELNDGTTSWFFQEEINGN